MVVTMNRRRLALYSEADVAIEGFAQATGVRCPTGCGACCFHTTPEVTVADARPLAEAAIARGEGAALLARAREVGEGICVLYAGDEAGGRCTSYAERPMLCRMYGFAAMRRGAPGMPDTSAGYYMPCLIHARRDPDAVGVAVAAADRGEIPIFPDWQGRADALVTGGAGPRLPMNEAIAAALELAMSGAATGEPDGPDAGAPDSGA
jgi:uncharacterized protein